MADEEGEPKQPINVYLFPPKTRGLDIQLGDRFDRWAFVIMLIVITLGIVLFIILD